MSDERCFGYKDGEAKLFDNDDDRKKAGYADTPGKKEKSAKKKDK